MELLQRVTMSFLSRVASLLLRELAASFCYVAAAFAEFVTVLNKRGNLDSSKRIP